MRTTVWRGVTAAVAAAALVTACGGSDTSGSAGASAPETTGEVSADVTAARDYVEPYLASPKELSLDEPLSRKPDAGKKLVAISNGSPSNVVLDEAIREAAAVLGWDLKVITAGATAEEQQSAFNSAVQLRPDGITLSGIPRRTITAGLEAAAAAGIPVSINASTDKPGGAVFDTSISGPAQLATWGKMVAAFVTSESKGEGKIAVFDLPVYPILHEFVASFQDGIDQWCPGCETTEVHQQGADIGSKTPGSVVSTLQRSPDTDWVVFDLGDLSTGLGTALRGAGLVDSVKVGGLTANTENIKGVADGSQHAWTAYPLPIVGWRVIDAFARQFNGDSLAPTVGALLPTQLITQDNVDSLVLDDEGNYVGLADYQEQFKSLWKLQ